MMAQEAHTFVKRSVLTASLLLYWEKESMLCITRVVPAKFRLITHYGRAGPLPHQLSRVWSSGTHKVYAIYTSYSDLNVAENQRLDVDGTHGLDSLPIDTVTLSFATKLLIPAHRRSAPSGSPLS